MVATILQVGRQYTVRFTPVRFVIARISQFDGMSEGGARMAGPRLEARPCLRGQCVDVVIDGRTVNGISRTAVWLPARDVASSRST